MQPSSQIATSFTSKVIKLSLCLCVSVVIISFSAISQTVEVEKSTKIEKVEGKEYYIHTIVKGQTLYSVSKAYNVLISEIIFENPEAIDGIKPDMQLKIPVGSNSLDNTKPVEINGKNRIHRVEKGETLYSISREYLISVETIKQANPGLSDTLKLGQNLNIPVVQLVKSGETVYTSAVLENLNHNPADFNIALLVPIFLAENDKAAKLDSAAEEVKEGIYSKSLNGLEFYEGAVLAADTIGKMGVKANMFVYDISDDQALTDVLSKPMLKEMDLIIGPFYAKRFEVLSVFAEEHKIPCVTPVLRKNELIEKKSLAQKTLSSEETQMKQMGDFIGRWNCKKNIIVMYNGSLADSLLLAYLLPGIKSRCDSAKVHMLNTKGKSVKLVDSLILQNVENIVVSLSTDENYVSRLVLHLEKKNNKQRVVTLFGLNEWQDFENIEVEYFQNTNLHFPADMFVDYNRGEVKDFLKKFRERYLAEPGQYAFMGYDVTLYYLQMLNKFGKTFYEKPEAIHATGLQTNFDFKKISEQGGLENQCTFILNYNDYRLVKVN